MPASWRQAAGGRWRIDARRDKRDDIPDILDNDESSKLSHEDDETDTDDEEEDEDGEHEIEEIIPPGAGTSQVWPPPASTIEDCVSLFSAPEDIEVCFDFIRQKQQEHTGSNAEGNGAPQQSMVEGATAVVTAPLLAPTGATYLPAEAAQTSSASSRTALTPTTSASSEDLQPSPSVWTPEGKPSPPGGLSKAHFVAAVMIPLLVFFLIFGGLFYCRTRSRRNRASAGSRAMKVNQDIDYRPVTYVTPQQPQQMSQRDLLPMPPQPSISNVPPLPYDRPPAGRPPSTQPIILGPMSQSNSGNYHTGLDADVLSIPESRVEHYQVEDPDEPPPPYRPRSVLSFVSRESSMRQASVQPIPERDESRRNLMPIAMERSPFADPDDDAASEISELSRHPYQREHEVMSAVSDLSYQHSVRRS